MTDFLSLTDKMFKSSSELYYKPSFLDGMGSVFNIRGNHFDYNYSKNGAEADINAIRRDWDIVGNDLFNSIHLHTK
ncbi:MAG: hypothetical protein PVF73_07450 [Bacteroidales bacterium]|jgi:hypothetical protein